MKYVFLVFCFKRKENKQKKRKGRGCINGRSIGIWGHLSECIAPSYTAPELRHGRLDSCGTDGPHL